MGLLRLLRRFPRVNLDTNVALSFDGRPLLARSVDISEGGIGLRLATAPPADSSRVLMSFFLPGRAEALETVGRISRPVVLACDNHFRFGMSFPELSAEDRRALRRYINTRRFLYGDLRAPSTNPAVEKRMAERLVRARRH